MIVLSLCILFLTDWFVHTLIISCIDYSQESECSDYNPDAKSADDDDETIINKVMNPNAGMDGPIYGKRALIIIIIIIIITIIYY